MEIEDDTVCLPCKRHLNASALLAGDGSSTWVSSVFSLKLPLTIIFFHRLHNLHYRYIHILVPSEVPFARIWELPSRHHFPKRWPFHYYQLTTKVTLVLHDCLEYIRKTDVLWYWSQLPHTAWLCTVSRTPSTPRVRNWGIIVTSLHLRNLHQLQSWSKQKHRASRLKVFRFKKERVWVHNGQSEVL